MSVYLLKIDDGFQRETVYERLVLITYTGCASHILIFRHTDRIAFRFESLWRRREQLFLIGFQYQLIASMARIGNPTVTRSVRCVIRDMQMRFDPVLVHGIPMVRTDQDPPAFAEIGTQLLTERITKRLSVPAANHIHERIHAVQWRKTCCTTDV